MPALIEGEEKEEEFDEEKEKKQKPKKIKLGKDVMISLIEGIKKETPRLIEEENENCIPAISRTKIIPEKPKEK